MESKAKLAGHAVHPMLIVFPLGLLATALIFDLIYLANGNTRLADASYWMIGAGIVGGIVAAVFGTIDWLGIPANTRAKAIGLWHGIGNVLVLVCFAISWAIRNSGVTTAPTGGAVTLSVIGVLIALVTGWMGGELVERLGVGVDTGAHLNAPNSMGGRPATDSDQNYGEVIAPATGAGTGVIPGRGAMGRAPDTTTERREGAARPTTQDVDRGAPPV